MIVLLKGDISGTRDGLPWPPRGSTVDLPDDEALKLCASGMAVPMPDVEVETAMMAPDAEVRALSTTNAAAVARRRKP